MASSAAGNITQIYAGAARKGVREPGVCRLRGYRHVSGFFSAQRRNGGKCRWEFSLAENSRGIGVADMAAAIAAGREHRANERMAYHVLDSMHSIVDASETGRHSEMRSAMSRPRAATARPADGKSRILGG